MEEEEHIALFNKSKNYWNAKDVTKRNKKTHMDWCHEHNYGITYFGFHPKLFPIKFIGNDLFHCCSSITRRMMISVQKFMMRQDSDLMFEFSKLLKSFWKKYRVLIWNLHGPFQFFIGKELLQFILTSNIFKNFLKIKFTQTKLLVGLCYCLLLWGEISKFLVVVKLLNKEKYEESLNKFKNNIKELFKNAKHTFIMTKNETTPGNNETFYLHALKCYFPQLVTKLFEKHCMGLGNFTMQGFEQRNKESKHILTKYSNQKGNILIGNLQRFLEKNY